MHRQISRGQSAFGFGPFGSVRRGQSRLKDRNADRVQWGWAAVALGGKRGQVDDCRRPELL